MTNWFCIHTKPVKEAQVARYCHEVLGVQPYYPRLRERRTIRRVKRDVLSPLFPRYLFCRFDAAIHHRAVRYAPEVLSIVSVNGTPTMVSDTIIESLRNWAGESLDVLTIRPGFCAGDPVEITDGPMRGLEAVFLEEMRGVDRVAVLLSALQWDARLVLSPSQLQHRS